jgi:hypothetical protein
MHLDDLIDGLKSRLPWQTLKAILSGLEIPTLGKGKNDTITKLKSYLQEEENISSIEELSRYYLTHLLVGEKAVRVFRVEKNIIKNIVNSFKDHKPPESAFHNKYPFPLGEEELREIQSGTRLVEVKNLDQDLQLVFCTKRFFSERLDLNPNIIREEERKNLGVLSELIAIKQYSRQFFDVVIFREKESVVEIRIDVSSGMLSDDRYHAFLQIIDALNLQINNVLEIDSILAEPVNFFPIISNLYESDEGRVCELVFTTDGGSIKHEKMRIRNVDLRVEAYHEAGKKAVDHITPYRLAIRWNFVDSNKVKTEPELLLPGNIRSLSINQRLEEAIIEKCSSKEDYDFVFGKIITHLN